MTRYRERLTPGPGTALAVLLLLPAVFIVALPLRLAPAAPILIAIAATAVAETVLFASAPVVEVRDGLLRAASARIPVALTGGTEVLRRQAARTARGPRLDARAWVLFRGWIDPVVRIEITDPDDPAPYWVLSSRRPEELAGALAAERADHPAPGNG